MTNTREQYRELFIGVESPMGKLRMVRDMLQMRAAAPSGQVNAWEVEILGNVMNEALLALHEAAR